GPFSGGSRRYIPTWHPFINWFAIDPLRGIAGWNIETFSIKAVADTNRNRIHFIEAIEIGDREFIDPVDHGGVMGRHCVEPTAAAGASRPRSKFAPHFMQSFSKTRIFRWQRSLADPRRVGFHHANDAVH